MELNKVYFDAVTEAANAALFTKDMAVHLYSEEHDVPLSRIAAIGDGISDLPFLMMPGLGMICAPANAQETVKQLVRQKEHGYVSQKEVFDAFVEFYNAVGVTCTDVITDKNGVLLQRGNFSQRDRFYRLACEAGWADNPNIAILTGSSAEQNQGFIEGYGLNRLDVNPVVRTNPYILLVENGAIDVDVLSGKTRNHCSQLNQELFELLKKRFEPRMHELIEQHVLDEFGLQWTDDYGDQKGKIYHVPKDAMVTFNVPHSKGDVKDYRKTAEAEKLRKRFLALMVDAAEEIGMPYAILENKFVN